MLEWLLTPRHKTGLHLLDASGDWQYQPYADLARRVQGVSEQLVEHGLQGGEAVAIAAGTCDALIVGFFGILHAGCTAVPLPVADDRPSERVDHTSHVVSEASVACTLVDCAALAIPLQDAMLNVVVADGRRVRSLNPRPAATTSMIQFTSGSTAVPRGVCISRRALATQISMLWEWLNLGPHDGMASWLPWHHDMGLVGTLVMPVTKQLPIWYMKPRDFLADPRRWLECLGGAGATVTAAPGFAYGYTARRVKPESLIGLDFRDWRSAVAGAELLSASELADFATMLRPYGLAPTAIRPAYGLAEATLAVAGLPLGSPPRCLRLSPQAVRIGDVPRSLSWSNLAEAGKPGLNTSLVTSGQPLPGVAIRIVDEQGRTVDDGTIGEVAVRSPALADGYTRIDPDAVTRLVNGELRTGDSGLVLEGDLVVLGRYADSIKTRGRTIFADGLELALANAYGIPRGNCAVLYAPHTMGGPEIVVLVEDSGPPPSKERVVSLVRALRGATGPIRSSIRMVAHGTLLRTSSGKPRRRAMGALAATNQIEGTIVWSSDPDIKGSAEGAQ